jgi:hypothetical protein
MIYAAMDLLQTLAILYLGWRVALLVGASRKGGCCK